MPMAPAFRATFSIAASIAALLVIISPARAVDVAESGVAMIPPDAAFVSATLRGREQFDRIVNSKAFAALMKLPGVTRATESLEEQKMQPGSPLSIIDTFMQLPENQQAVDVLKSMVATDTFLYGEPSCIAFVQLLQKVQRAQQAANLIAMARGDASFDDFGDLDGLELDQLQDDDAEDEDDGAAAPRRVRAQLARFQAADAVESLSAEDLAARLMIKTVADNTDLLVVPDLVWGFAIADKAAAETQLKRVEVLLKLAAQANPELADAVARKTIGEGDFVTFTVDPDVAALRQGMREIEGTADDVDKIFAKAEELTFVWALGIVGDRVIMSLGDSTEHLEKLVTSGGVEKGLLGTAPLAPLMAHRDKPITGVNYVSEALMKVVSPSTADIDQFAELSGTLVELADLPPEAAGVARRELEAMSAQYRKWLPVPGPWMSFSFMTEQGYEGYAWDWAKNTALDGSKRLELLEHAGGAPLGVLVARSKTDVPRFNDLAAWGGMGWRFFRTYVLPKADEEVREKVDAVDEHLGPVARKFVEIVRTKISPALADGQVGLVLDAKSKTKRLQRTLPEAEEPLPIVEPAIVLGLDDPKLFREGLSDLFALTDEFVDAVREIDPDSVPAEYRVADPEKSKVEGGSIWAWKLEKSGLDDQVRPAIAVGNDAAVFSLVPKQAARLIVETRLETGSQLAKFEEPLAAAAAVDVAGLIDALQPWVVYLTRYGCVQQRDGSVDPDATLDADVETPQAKDALEQAKAVFEALKSIRVAVAETTAQPDATVTHWRNVVRDTK